MHNYTYFKPISREKIVSIVKSYRNRISQLNDDELYSEWSKVNIDFLAIICHIEMMSRDNIAKRSSTFWFDAFEEEIKYIERILNEQC